MKINEYLQNTLLFGILRSGTIIGERLSTGFRPTNLNYIQALILVAISRENASVRPKLLRETFGLSSGAVSQSITHLARAHYLERKISSSDARGYELVLTTKGRAQANRLINFIERLERDVEKTIGHSSRTACLKTLRSACTIVGGKL